IIYKGKEDLVLKKAKEVYEILKDKYSVKIDYSDESVGNKFYFWELKGVPIRIEVGPKEIENHKIKIVKRHDGKNFEIKEELLEKKIDEISQNYTKEIKKKSLIDFESQIECVYEKDAAIEAINNGKIVCCGFCSIDMDAYRCAEVVEKEIGGFVRGKRVEEEKHEFATCLICGKPAGCTVYIAKSY
ncbi:MAG: His/Gly/Thr/Pro-type tRNA ligase C-terminal domain-containing protein, partial [Candidatus Hermodarchaeota archaeon]